MRTLHLTVCLDRAVAQAGIDKAHLSEGLPPVRLCGVGKQLHEYPRRFYLSELLGPEFWVRGRHEGLLVRTFYMSEV